MTEAERALRSVLDSARRAGADEPRELPFGPIPMTVQADDPALVDQAAAHAAGEPGAETRETSISRLVGRIRQLFNVPHG